MTDAPHLPLRTGRKAPHQTIYDATDRMVAVGITTADAAWLAQRVNGSEPTDLDRIREAFAPVLTAWQSTHDLYRERADRKGYSSDEVAAELLEAAIESVTAILVALDQPQGTR